MHSKSKISSRWLEPSRTGLPVSNKTEAGKRVSATKSLLLLSEKQGHHSIINDQTVHFSQYCIFQPKVTLSFETLLITYWQTAYLYARSIGYAISFSTVIKTGSVSLNKRLQCCREFSIFQQRSDRLISLQRATQVL